MKTKENFKDKNLACFIENLNFPSWFFSVLPWLIGRRISGGREVFKIFIFESTKSGLFFSRLTIGLLSAHIEQMKFRFFDVRDKKGMPAWWNMLSRELFILQGYILEDPAVKETLLMADGNYRIRTYFKKESLYSYPNAEDSMWRAVSILQILYWKAKNDSGLNSAKKILFLNQRVWFNALTKYASSLDIMLVSTKKIQINLKNSILSFLGPITARWLCNICALVLKPKLGISTIYAKAISKGRDVTNWRIAVEYYGHLNLDRPDLHSDLFFWQQSSLKGKDILITFNISSDPLDEQKYSEILKHGMDVVALSAKATRLNSLPLFSYLPRKTIKTEIINTAIRERKWLRQETRDYYSQLSYWTNFFSRYSVKVHITWFKYNAQHCIIADALYNIQGASTIYQRALEEFSMPGATLASDIVFAFSKDNAAIEQNSGSFIPYHVAVGYIGDHRFPLVREFASDLRQRIQLAGARYIVAFFDENSTDDPRWNSGHDFTRRNYTFLLEKVLSTPWLGLIIKPKSSCSLKKRLGEELTVLLDKAQQTGRCYVFEGGKLHNSYPPCLAALASDVAIHGHLCAATAGLESALSGVPTLLMDPEKCPLSTMYRLGKGKVAFDSWDDLWKVSKEHWNSPSGVPGFGDWSPIINEFDPFRDGKAAERIGNYLKWLLEGYNSGLSKNIVLADAAQRYGDIWGHDKIKSINV